MYPVKGIYEHDDALMICIGLPIRFSLCMIYFKMRNSSFYKKFITAFVPVCMYIYMYIYT